MKHFLFQYTSTLPQCTLALSSVFTLFKITTRARFWWFNRFERFSSMMQLIWHIDWVPAQINEVPAPKKANFFLTITTTTPTQTNYLLTTTTAFLMSPPCLFVQQTTTIYLTSVNKPIAIPEGLIIGCILRFTRGWAGGRDHKRQFTVCDWPGFKIWNHRKWQVRSGKLKGLMGLVFLVK